MGPSAVRIAGLGERLTALGCTVIDKGDLLSPIPETRVARDPSKRYIKDIARVCQKVYQQGRHVPWSAFRQQGLCQCAVGRGATDRDRR